MRTIAVLGLALFSACGNGSAKPPQAKDTSKGPRDAQVADADPSKMEGMVLYRTFCAQCHGDDAKGYKADNAPSLVNPTFLESATDEYIHRSIFGGRPGTSMAAYGKELGGPLDKDAIDRVVQYLRMQGPPAKPLATATVTGDAKRGAEIYARECVKCHGDATTRGNTVHLANVNFLGVASDDFLRHAITVGRPGTPMEAFASKLDAQAIEDLVAFVRSYAGGKQPDIASTPGLLPPPTGTEPLVLNPKGKDPAWKNLRRDPGSERDRYVSIDEVNKALADKRKLVIIDARPASDWMRAHITGAVSIPHFDATQPGSQGSARLDQIPKDAWVIAYCACPHHLSGIVVDALWGRGHTRALVLDEGVLEWHRRGYPMTTAPGVQPPPKEDHSGHSHQGHGH